MRLALLYAPLHLNTTLNAQTANADADVSVIDVSMKVYLKLSVAVFELQINKKNYTVLNK